MRSTTGRAATDLPDSGGSLAPEPQQLELDQDGIFDAAIPELPSGAWAGDMDGDRGPESYDAEVDWIPELVVDGQLVGDPEGASEHWFEQAANGYCVPASVAQIVSEYSRCPPRRRACLRDPRE